MSEPIPDIPGKPLLTVDYMPDSDNIIVRFTADPTHHFVLSPDDAASLGHLLLEMAGEEVDSAPEVDAEAIRTVLHPKILDLHTLLRGLRELDAAWGDEHP